MPGSLMQLIRDNEHIKLAIRNVKKKYKRKFFKKTAALIHFFNVIGEMSSDLDFNILRVTMSENVDFKVANQNAKNSLKWPKE